jgi:DNA-binding MarR family transcriptional regulator
MKDTHAPDLQAGPKQDLMRQISEFYPKIDLVALDLINNIKTVSKLHTAIVSQGLARFDLTEARMYLLCSLFLHEKSGGSPLSPSDISERLAITRATVTSLLDGLQESEFIVREVSGGDRRSIKIKVTEKASLLIDNLMSQGMPKLDSALSFLSHDERKSMSDSLSKIAANMERHME